MVPERLGAATRAAPALGLRSDTERASAPGLVLTALIVGVVSASVPAGLLDRVNGTGMFIGGSAAMVGTAASAPLVLAYLVAQQLGGAEEAGRLRDLYLQHVPMWIPRTGAVMAALRDWLRFSVAAVITGALVGLGDALRVNGGAHIWGSWPANPVAVIGIEIYVLALAVFWGSLFRSASAALLWAFALPAFALALLPLTLTEPWLLTIIKSTPLAPLWASASTDGFGRYALTMSDTARNLLLAGWTTFFVLGSWAANRGNRAALTHGHREQVAPRTQASRVA